MLKVGKLDSNLLQKIVIDNIKFKRDEVRVRAGVGEDCAVVDYGDYDCVVSTDPITASVNDIGRLAIHISCNDIASNGIEPLAITLALMLPEGTSAEEIETIMKQAGEASEAAGVEIIGGHTEITKAVNQPVIVSTAFGRCESGKFQKATDMVSGDYVLMTKKAGLEGSGIIASDLEDELLDILTAEEIAYAKKMLDSVSVIKEGVIAGKIGTAGMHDVTEGGILGAVWEMCRISGLGAEIREDDISVDPVTLKIAEKYDIDWKRFISSGCLLIIVHADKKDELMAALTESGIEVSCIGEIKDKDFGLKMIKSDGTIEKIDPPAEDELYKAIGK